MAALAIGLGADGHFSHKRGTCVFEVLGQRTRGARTEIVGIGDEQILEAALLQYVKQTRLPDGGEQVAVAGRAPFQLRVRRVAHRFAGGGHELGFLMLDDFHRHVMLAELAMMLEHLHRVRRSVEGVHERQRQLDVQACTSGKHLTDDDVDEAHLLGLVPTHRQQRLGLVQSHGGAQTAIELEECGFGEGVHGLVVVDGLIDVVEAGHVAKRLDVVLANPAGGFFMAPYVIQMAELVDGGFAHAMLAHLGGRKLESLIHFGGVYGFFGGIRGDGVGVAGGGDIQLGLIVYFGQFGSLSSNQ